MPVPAGHVAKYSDKGFRSLYENSFDSILLTKPDGSILSANPAACRMFRMTEKQIQKVGRNGLVVFDKRLDTALRERQSKGKAMAELTMRRKDGSTFEAEVTSSIFTDANGTTKTSMIIRDVTERKKTQEALTESQLRLRLLADNMRDVVWIMDLNGRVTYVSPSIWQLRGYTPEEVVQQSLGDMLTTDSEQIAKKFLQLMRETGEAPTKYLEVEQIRKDGTTVWTEINFNIVRDKNGKPQHILGVSRDITERRKVEQSLRASEERYREFVNSLPELVFESDLTGKLTYISQRAIDFTGYTNEELEGRNMLEFVAPEDRKRAIENMKRSLAGENLGATEYALFRKDGTTYPALIRTSRIVSGNKVIGLRGLIIEITERKKAEEALKESEEKFRGIVENSSDFIMLTLPNGDISYLSPSTSNVLGHKPEELFNKNPNIFHPDDAEKISKTLARALAGEKGSGFEYRIITTNGEIRWVSHSWTPIVENGKLKLIVSTVRDITEHKKAEEKLRASEAKYRSLFDNMLNGFAHCKMIFDAKGNPVDFVYLDVNDAFERLTGLKRETVIGRNVTEAIPGIRETNPELFDTYGRVCKTGKEERFEVFSGPLKIWLSIIAYSLDKDYFAIVFENITERKKVEEALRVSETKFRELAESISDVFFAMDTNLRYTYWNMESERLVGISAKDAIGKSLTEIFPEVKGTEMERFYLNVLKTKQHQTFINNFRIGKNQFAFEIDAYPTKEGIAVFSKDITERKKMQDRITSINEKLRVVGKLTRHDIRNKLTAIAYNTYLLNEKLGSNPEVAKRLAHIDSEIDMANRIFDFSRIYEQIGVADLEEISIGRCFNEAVDLVPDVGNVKIINQSKELIVIADSLLRQIFYNLIDNSLKHGEKVTCIKLHYAKEDKQIKLLFEDNGVGVPPENKHKVFIEGFTTGKGAGLGLAVIKKIIEVYGWSIQETGIPDKGAKFEITIPESSIVQS